MPVRVLIVDDSGFFRQRISGILSQDSRIEVVGTANNGLEAIEKNSELRPDVITMDVEMPKLNGIDAVKQIMRDRPAQVLMLSSLTHEGAQVTLQAMDAGAVDYLTKDMRAWVDKSQSLNDDLISRIIALGKSKHFVKSALSHRYASKQTSKPQTSSSHVFRLNEEPKVQAVAKQQGLNTKPALPPRCKLVVIGSSTGGPAALQEILTKLPANFPYPILLVQHMPNTFTSVFAERLNQQCEIEVKQAESGDRLAPGKALLAPGGQQMILDGTDKVKVLVGDERLTYKPSVDVTYASVAKHFRGDALAVILTGMGADGRDGAKLLKASGAVIWAQSEATCTIYGMPQAVIKAGLANSIIDLKDFSRHLTGAKF